MAKPEIKIKLIILGDATVGKTSMLLKYTENKFSESHISTIGVEFKNKIIETDKFKILLQIWDTSGQERYQAIAKSFIQGSNGIIFVYDITNRPTYNNVKEWVKNSEMYGVYSRVVCGNKIDLDEKRQVKFDELKEYGLKKRIDYFEISAKNGDKIEDAFRKVVDLVLNSHTEEELIRDFGFKGKGITLAKGKKREKDEKNCNC